MRTVAFFGGFGLLFFVAGLDEWSHQADAPLATSVIIPVIGLFSVVFAPYVWVNAPDRKFSFDPSLKKAILESQSRGVVVYREINFGEIVGLETEEGRDGENYLNHRPVLRLADGRVAAGVRRLPCQRTVRPRAEARGRVGYLADPPSCEAGYESSGGMWAGSKRPIAYGQTALPI
ncbi:MAG: hypothetical protein JJT96_14545 [Opitutales bacterium]|nr:hypothetical protein [Opitutales bacterium]